MHQLLQKARDERNLTNAQISRALNKSESYICKIMSGQRSAGPLMSELCRFLGIPEPTSKEAKTEVACDAKRKNRERQSA